MKIVNRGIVTWIVRSHQIIQGILKESSPASKNNIETGMLEDTLKIERQEVCQEECERHKEIEMRKNARDEKSYRAIKDL